MYGPSFDSHKDSLLAYPRTPYNLPPEPPTEDEPESDAEPEPIKTPVAPKLSLWSMLTGQASAAGSTFVPLSLNDTKEPVMKRKPKPDADNSSEGGEPTDDDKKRVKRSKAAQGNRMRKLDENERKAVYEAAKQRGEITSYDKTSFTCTCPKKQKGLILSIINLKTPYDIQDMKQHFANLCHKRIYELDDQGRAKIEENTGKVIRKVKRDAYGETTRRLIAASTGHEVWESVGETGSPSCCCSGVDQLPRRPLCGLARKAIHPPASLSSRVGWHERRRTELRHPLRRSVPVQERQEEETSEGRLQ